VYGPVLDARLSPLGSVCAAIVNGDGQRLDIGETAI
jgi:hypothetical protein